MREKERTRKREKKRERKERKIEKMRTRSKLNNIKKTFGFIKLP